MDQLVLVSQVRLNNANSEFGEVDEDDDEGGEYDGLDMRILIQVQRGWLIF